MSGVVFMYKTNDLIYLVISFLVVFYILDVMGGTIIEAIIAIVIATSIFKIIDYFFQGPNLRVVHDNRQIENEKPLTYRHIICIENKGKRSGFLKNIIIEPTDKVKQSYLMVDKITNFEVAPISIDGKKAKTVWIDCSLETKDTKYWITAIYEKSIVGLVYKRKKTIWSN